MSTTVIEAVTQVEEAATKADPGIRNAKNLKIGEYVRQGDVYIVRTDGRRLNKQKPVELKERNLAAGGTGTAARHEAQGDVTVYGPLGLDGLKLRVTEKDVNGVETAVLKPLRDILPNASPVFGPTVVSEGDWLLSHPEHAHCEFGAGTFQTLFQVDFRSQQRVQD